MRAWPSKIGALFRQRQLDDEMDEEIRTHLEMAADENRRRGMSPSHAQRAARRSFGGIDQIRETCRETRGLRWVDDLRSDLRFGLRGLARNPSFTVTAVLVLSVGIGATAAMFNVSSAFLLRPFPAPDPDRLVVLAQHDVRHDATASGVNRLSYPAYLDYRNRNQVLEGLAAYDSAGEILAAAGVSGPVSVEYVSHDFFEVLRVDAALGRTFRPDDGRDAAVVVLSHRAWQNRFGADPSVVGRVVGVGSTQQTVIGVAPESFVFTDLFAVPELYAPVTQFGHVGANRDDLLTDRSREVFSLIGRLRPGVTLAAARANLGVLHTALVAEYPDSMEHTELVVEWERRARPTPEAARLSALLMAFVMALASLVLLIACANVATLLIGRGVGRQREMALRAGLGATRLRLVRQLLSESVLLALLGGTGGALAALWATDVLGTMGTIDVGMDWRAFAFTAVAAIVTGVITGFAPALRTTRVDLTRAIGQGGRGANGGPTGQRLTSALIVAQVAMSVLLLVCAGLFVRSGQNAANLDVGFRTDHLLLLSVDPLGQGYGPEQALGFYRDVVDEVAALPGVRSASWASMAPQRDDTNMDVVTLDGGAISETDPVRVYSNRVDPAFFATVDVPVMLGRGFSPEDAEGQAVAVISEAAARQFWPDQDALGKRFFTPTAPERPFAVIGIARDALLEALTTEMRAVVHLPFGQRLSGPATLHVHTEGPPTALASTVTEVVRQHDPTLAVYGLTSMDTLLNDGLLATSRRAAWLFGAFGGLGLVLAAVGLYGMVAYSVTQRMHEFGIRTALGATAAGILRLALGRSMVLTGIGLVLGALSAAAVTPFTAGFLVGVEPTDAVVFGVTALVLAGVALLACLVPARRAARVDPLATLNAG